MHRLYDAFPEPHCLTECIADCERIEFAANPATVSHRSANAGAHSDTDARTNADPDRVALADTDGEPDGITDSEPDGVSDPQSSPDRVTYAHCSRDDGGADTDSGINGLTGTWPSPAPGVGNGPPAILPAPLDRRDPTNQIGRAAAYFALFSEIGFALAIPIIVGVLGGEQIDRSIGTWPIFVLVGSLGGMALGGFASYRLITRFLARFEGEPRASGDRRDGTGGPE